jgi:hypothetical protein
METGGAARVHRPRQSGAKADKKKANVEKKRERSAAEGGVAVSKVKLKDPRAFVVA